MDPRTTSITFTVADGTDAREPMMGLPRRWRRILGVIVCALLCIGLSMAGIHSPSSVVADDDWMTPMQKSYTACMEAWDLPVSIGPPSQYGTSVDITGRHTIVWRDPYGFTGTGIDFSFIPVGLGGDTPSPSYIAENDAIYKVIALTGKPLLAVDGTDYTSQYIACLDQSGYTAEVAQEQAGSDSSFIVTPDELDVWQALFQPQVQVNNQWAACARDHGWLVFDSTVAGLGTETVVPEVYLPSSITPDQLHTLLAACPNFDSAAARRFDDWLQAHPVQWTVTTDMGTIPVIDDSAPAMSPNPNVGFRLTPFETAHLSALFSPEGQALFARLVPLYRVLDEQYIAYSEAQSLAGTS